MDGSVPQRDLYRAHALECLEEARAVKDRELSNVFHRLAMWWVILAHQTEDDERGPRNATVTTPKLPLANISKIDRTTAACSSSMTSAAGEVGVFPHIVVSVDAVAVAAGVEIPASRAPDARTEQRAPERCRTGTLLECVRGDFVRQAGRVVLR
jgi:hypothetical protein